MKQPVLRVLFDEGVPIELAHTFLAAGHEVIPFKEVLQPSANDELVCAVALLNKAVLVAFNKDHKQIAKKNGVSGDKFKRLSLISLNCPEPLAKSRVEQAMTLIEHEWVYSTGKIARRLFIIVGRDVIKTYR